ncbi:MAG: ADP-ribosylglycohydrolase family protein [Planctomycetota bacterium]
MRDSCLVGCMLGTAVGDAIGLPYEGVSRRRIPRLLGPPDRHRLIFGRGMISDDTEHTCLVAQSLVVSGSDVDAFERDFARRLRWWFASLPAGIGRATLRSCLRLWMGTAPKRSGVFSAGNGPAMRSAILGVYFDDVRLMAEFVRVSTRVTHSDPRAEHGAMAVALAAHIGCRDEIVDGRVFLERLAALVGDQGSELIDLLQRVLRSVSEGQPTDTFTMNSGMERGVSGYTYHTVPVVIHAWLTNPRDYRAAVSSVIECGGDTDTTAAIVGGIIGASTGESGIPSDWVNGIIEWPRSVHWMRRLSEQLNASRSSRVASPLVSTSYLASLVRNIGFFVIVLVHGFRRLFPPF